MDEVICSSGSDYCSVYTCKLLKDMATEWYPGSFPILICQATKEMDKANREVLMRHNCAEKSLFRSVEMKNAHGLP